jgi:4-diphosphocytidyl-2-C-methyl-D-erythritol kinase
VGIGGGGRPYAGMGGAQAGATLKFSSKLTSRSGSDRIEEFGRMLSVWLSGLPDKVPQKKTSFRSSSGVPAVGRGRAETLLLDLVRTGIENDFESVVFPQYPAIREVKRVLERSGAFYASLSGSGSAVYGLYRTRAQAEQAARRLNQGGIPASATTTLTRSQYRKRLSI